jgi:hypothetical protein
MKNVCLILLLTSAGLAAQASARTGPTAHKATKKAPAASKAATIQPVTIPADATANGDGTFSWTDKQGKKWTYAKTPFGVMRSEVRTAPEDAPSLADVKAFDEGDKVRFEKQSPFGIVKWEKNKADLTAGERDLLTKQAASQTAKQENQ